MLETCRFQKIENGKQLLETCSFMEVSNGKLLPDGCEHVPGPILIPVSIRVFRTTFPIGNSINYFKIEVRRSIFGFWDRLFRFREENAVLQVNQVNLIYIIM